MSLQSFSKYLNPNNLPVEQMSNQNAIGENTGYPMAYMNTPAYAVPRNIPQAQNIIQGGQDVRVDTYSGEEKFADGGGVMGKAMNMGDKLYQFLIGKGEYPGIEKQTMPTAVGQQLYDASGKAMPRYQLNPDGTFSLAGQKAPAVTQGISGMNQPASSGYFSRMAAQQDMLPTTPMGEQKPWNQWTAEEKSQWAKENPGLAAFDTKVHSVVDPAAAFVTSGGLTGAALKGIGSLFNSGVGTTVNERNPAAISAYNQQPGWSDFFKNLTSGTTGNNAPIVEGISPSEAPQPSGPISPIAAANAENLSSGNINSPEARAIAAIQASNVNAGEGSWGGEGGGESAGSKDGGLMHSMAEGGISSLYNLGSYSDGGRLLKGPGDGVSDDIPAVIGDSQPARLANNEFVIPARIVSEIGNGSTDAGAKKLYEMMDRVQAARKKSIGKGKIAVNSKSYKELDKL